MVVKVAAKTNNFNANLRSIVLFLFGLSLGAITNRDATLDRLQSL